VLTYVQALHDHASSPSLLTFFSGCFLFSSTGLPSGGPVDLVSVDDVGRFLLSAAAAAARTGAEDADPVSSELRMLIHFLFSSFLF